MFTHRFLVNVMLQLIELGIFEKTFHFDRPMQWNVLNSRESIPIHVRHNIRLWIYVFLSHKMYLFETTGKTNENDS